MASKRPEQGRNRSKKGAHRKKRKPRGRSFRPGESGSKATQFPPGVSGNPAGRPPLPPEYKAAIAMLEPEAMEVLRDVLQDEAHPRRQQAAEYVLNRTQGRPRQTVEISGPDGKPVRIEGDDPVTTMLRAMIDKKKGGNDDGDGGSGAAPAG